MFSDRTITYILSGFLVLLTLGYVYLVWLGIGIISVLIPPDQYTFLSLLTVGKIIDHIWLGAVHWQLLAVIALVINLAWARKRCYLDGHREGIVLPIVSQILILFTLIVWHVIGVLDPMLVIGSVIG